ncbi:MAG TPA: histidine kinase dimerization/phospho-acceptor domain-containing protein, partial [Clostridia bacterium]|nr:histidine kinase dimerization/phospho-acceptor domain-containing protein [Clostridia bacterium]
MISTVQSIHGSIPRTYAEYESRITIQHLRVGCLLVMALMPAGIVLDFFMYRDHVPFFLGLRLTCSALEACIWLCLTTAWGRRQQRQLGLLTALFPAFFISWMIGVTEGWSSPYYAGLNLILLAIAFVLRWSVGLSLLAASIIISMYLGACFLHGPLRASEQGQFFNNCYFLLLTAIIVVVGSSIHRVLRINEYNLRFNLDRSNDALEEKRLQLEKSNEMLEASKAELEASNQKLKELDAVKSRFFANISHELRTPLTLLIAPLENLLHRFTPSVDQETCAMLQTMHANGMRLLKLINDLLDLVRMESGRMEVKREPLEVAELVKAIASAARQVAEDKRLRLETAVDPALG